MILDNRQVVPDIIVSRDGVPNNRFAYNINGNFNNNQENRAGLPERTGAEASPRHMSKGRPSGAHESQRHAYVTGNNNGSPRHVPHNGNYYSEPRSSPVYQRADRSVPYGGGSPVKLKDTSGKTARGSMDLENGYYCHLDNVPDKRSQRSPRHRPSNYESPVHNGHRATRTLRQNDTNSKEDLNNLDNEWDSPKRVPNNNNRVGNYSSPIHQNHRSSNVRQGIFYSPKHATKTSHLFSPRKRYPMHLDKKDNFDNVRKDGRPNHVYNDSFRPRSSSHPCEGSNLQAFGQSKIPVHVVKPRTRQSSGEVNKRSQGHPNENAIVNKSQSPCKTLINNHKFMNCNPLSRKSSMPEFHDRKLGSDFVSSSPKRTSSRNKNQNFLVTSSPKYDSKQKFDFRALNANKKEGFLETKRLNGDTWQWNGDKPNSTLMDTSWNIETERSEEENDSLGQDLSYTHSREFNKNTNRYRLESWPSSGSFKGNTDSDSEELFKGDLKYGEEEDYLSGRESGIDSEASGSVSSKIVLIKCRDANYLTRIYVNDEGVHGLKVVGRVGVGGSAQGHVMSLDQPAVALSDLNSNHSVCSDDVSKGCDATGRDVLSENAGSLISQTTDTEFEHEAADYQWLLDYEYRESYSRDCLGGARDGSTRVSVLQQPDEESHLSYETLSRNIDANLAEIDMDDFRSEDIHQLLSLPTICGELQDCDEDIFCSVSGSLIDSCNFNSSQQQPPSRCLHHQQQLRLHQQILKHQQQQLLQQQQEHQDQLQIQRDGGNFDDSESQHFDGEEREEDIEEEYSGVSGDVSLYQSGPLFSPLKDPPHIPPSFSVDSLDSDSIHEDLILTCQANKNNYTIAFEGSFVQYSEDSDYQEQPESDGTGSGTWSTERLEGRSPAPNMTYSDQPYTTWSRVSRRSSQSRTPDPTQTHSNKLHGQSPLLISEKQQPQINKQNQPSKQQQQQQQESKSNSMPNLMRRSLMRRSLETSGHCVKVYDLQNSLRTSQLSSTRSVDANNFSLMRLFIKQKSLSKEAVSLSSSCTDPSQEGACSSSENHSGVNDSSDWPMNSQSENDMDGSASPVPVTALNNHIVHERSYRLRGGSPNIMTINQDNTTIATDLNNTQTNMTTEGLLNNNNLSHFIDNGKPDSIDNITSFEDSLKEPNPCSKPPMTSPIREEPEGMDISVDSRCEDKIPVNETKTYDVLRLKDNNISNVDQIKTAVKSRTKDVINKNSQGNKNGLNILNDEKKKLDTQGTPKHQFVKSESLKSSQRRRQDSGNSSSGYVSNKGSTERIRRSSESDKIMNMLERPKPKPRSLKQVADQCLQTSNLKVSATVNTSGIVDKKEVYVYYPNYALPDLGFLKEKKYSVDARIFLVPQHYMTQAPIPMPPKDRKSKKHFSCGDMEKLRKHGFGHVRDWDSLNFLLPKELKEMLQDDTDCMETIKPSFCKTGKGTRRPVSCNYSTQQVQQEIRDSKMSSTSLNSTQPSSGFRGSSTMLNDSEGETHSPVDPRYVYRYDNTCIGNESTGTTPLRRPISITGEENHIPEEDADASSDSHSAKPLLPRGILRKCTYLREDPERQNSTKRHSSGDTSRVSMREDLLKRRSLQEPLEMTKDSKSLEREEKEDELSDKNNMGCSCVSDCTGFCAKGLRKKNLLLVNELPEVSSHEELTEADLVRLRSQVSEFLATKGSQVGSILAGDPHYATCDCPRKSVSFAEKACSHRQQQLIANRAQSTISKKGLKEASDAKSKDPVPSTPKKTFNIEEDLPPMLYDAHDKKTLVLSVRNAVEKLVMHFNRGTSQQEKNKLGTSAVTPEVAHLTLEKLCPAIYALLSDGLLPSLHSLFGKISNSVWRVVEATSQIGPSTKALNDLVLTLNSEECLSEGPIKFNAFIFGLLNIRSLDAWLSYLRTRESALQKHYHPESFLYLSNTATRGLYDDLLLALRPLALLPFRLDLLHEYKALHASLLKMEERLALHTSLSPSDTSIDLLLAAKESKEFRNVAARTTDRSRSPRPRSCHENAAGLENVHGALRKRWSGVQLGSKLVTAIDKLMTEDAGGTSSEDYTDSLDNPRKGAPMLERQDAASITDEVATDLRLSDLSSRDGDVSERSATDKDTDTEKGLRLHGKHLEKDNESEGERFRRLQLKWEAMTGQNSSGPKITSQNSEDLDKERSESITSPAGTQRSRIPRPVSITSPQQAFKPFDSSKDKTSPQVKQTKKTMLSKDHPKPAPRRSLKDRVVPTDHHDAQLPRGPSVRSRLGPRTTTPSLGPNRASSVPGRKMERGSSGSRYESQKKTTSRSASHGRRQGHAEQIRLVQTLHHRLATDNGHLSFSRGDVLTVIIEVDERYLLCCLHDRKGLVPRSSVITYHQ